MSTSNASRSGASWTNGETNILVRNHTKGRPYASIGSMKTFSGKRTIKALRRRFERTQLGLK